LNINDQGEDVNHQFIVTSTSVTRDGAAPINYANLETLNINAGSPPIIFFQPLDGEPLLNNYFYVKSTAANTTTNIHGAYGEFIVGSDTNSLDGIKGPLNLFEGRSLTLNDQGDNNANSYTVTSNSIVRSGAATISYQNVDFVPGVTINAGAFNDTVDVKSTSTIVVLNMGAGNDTVTLGDSFTRLDEINIVSVIGQAGIDSIVMNDFNNFVIPFSNDVRFSSSGVSRTSQSVPSRFMQLFYNTTENLTYNSGSGYDLFTLLGTPVGTAVTIRGGDGSDVFRFGNASSGVVNPSDIQGPVTLDGQGSTDTLDYSAYNVGVRVNLLNGTATGALGGVSNIEAVQGGSGNDVLIGDNQVNYLYGGAGRDFLIGNGGADYLYGGAGDDILIGDNTITFSSSQLEDIMREWGRTDLPGTPQQQYDARVRHLIIPELGGGLNGSTSLGGGKVFDDGATDFVDGGTELNWIIDPFIFNPH
jgi:Ca2+-binding RTX toxin-like protein